VFKSLLRDPDAEHQIVITGQGAIAVSCNCMRQPGRELRPIAVKSSWDGLEAVRAYRDWHAIRGIVLPAGPH
jgi:hypothetical protein